jgi:Fe-S cluster assembly protein SufD
MIEAKEQTSVYQSAFAALEKSKAAARNPWIGEVRRAAFQRFLALDFPTTRLEEWKYTSVAPIANTAFTPAGLMPASLTALELGRYTFSESECCQMVFMNGRFSPQLSCLQSIPRNARVQSLASALEGDADPLEPYLGRLAECQDNAFVALNTALVSDGAYIFVPPGMILREPIHLLHLSLGDSATMSHPRSLIVLGNGAQATVIESYVGLRDAAYFTNAATEVSLGKNAVLDHYKLQRESESSYHIAALHVRQEKQSTFSTHSISLGGSLVRNNVTAVLNGEGCDCTLNGLYVTKGKQHADTFTVIDHAKPNCTSRELYKGILDDQSTGAFNGRIIVRPDAQKTNSKQTNKNLLLSDNALVNARPQLEIFADDVKCTHGATIGRLNEDELFYLRSRGIAEKQARTLLTYAFANDILSAMKVKPVQCQIDLVLLSRLAHLN